MGDQLRTGRLLALATVAVLSGYAAAGEQAARARTAAVRAPSGPPLVGREGLAADGGEAADAESGEGAAAAESDPLVSNGLNSPICDGDLGGGELSSASHRDCETSGFPAAGAPTGNFGLDVHIDTGFLGVTAGSVVEDLFISPVWMALVWAVHALVVMLEWCFTIDLLDSPSVTASVGQGLRQAQRAFTEPWLASVLAIASMLAAYNGLIRRRVADTVAQAGLVLAMMAVGTWVTLDPVGTVGALAGWANQASLGALAASARGAPSGAGRVLADSTATVFSEAVEVPWCYLEFGDVAWCREPGRMSPQLRAAALKIADGELAAAGCSTGGSVAGACPAHADAQAQQLQRSAELLRDADSNGALFLALPANGPGRNSINDPGSLLRTMCQSSEATRCHGSMAAQAEFRTNSGTGARIGGLLLIVAGALGLLLLLGFIALRLLAAAIFSLLYLLLAPAAVLAPALGEAGRAVFRKWMTHLLGAVVAKLLFAFLLGVVLAVIAILAELGALGWWTQWLLMSAFWWGAFARRHQALALAGGVLGGELTHARTSTVRRAGGAIVSPRRALAGVRRAVGSVSKPPSSAADAERVADAGRGRANARAQGQAARLLEHDYRDARAHLASAPAVQSALSAKRAQLGRLLRARDRARASGHSRRASELARRATWVEAEIDDKQLSLNAARQVVADAEHARRATGSLHTRAQRELRSEFLDAQAELPAAALAARLASGAGRDYGALAGLAGYGRGEYEGMNPAGRRAVRLEVDRELALRRELTASARDAGASVDAGTLPRSQRVRAERTFDEALQRRMRDRGQRMPASYVPRDPIARWRAEGLRKRSWNGARESSVMRDAHEVARRRKRQLGGDRE